MSRLAGFFVNTINALTFLIILVGLPAVLVTVVGWPGPTAVPEVTKIESVITGREQVPPLFLIKSLTIVAWIVWLQLVIAMVEEIKAIRLDLVAKKSFVLPGIQKFVASAVLAITLLINGLKPASAATVAAPAPIAQPFEADQSEPPPAAPETVQTKSYITQAGDSWWKVAETFLGDGSRFAELRQLNVGKTFDGLIVQEDSDYLGIGWNIELPADAATPASITVQPGDTLSELEDKHGLNDGDLADANDIDFPDLIHPGQELDVPSPITESAVENNQEKPVPKPASESAPVETDEPAPAPESAPEPESASVKPSENPDRSQIGSGPQALPPLQAQQPQIVDAEDPSISQLDEEVNVGGRIAVGGLLSALAFLAPALWSVRNRRFRAAMRTVTTDQPSFEPLDEVDAAKMVAAASYGDDEFMAVLLRLVGQRMSSARQDPGLLAITIDNDSADLLFEHHPAFEPGPGFVSTGNGWTAKRPKTLNQMKSQASISIVPYPAMVSLGSIKDTSIAMNLEQLGGLNIIGSQSDTREVMFNIAVELASSDLAETIRIIAVGFEMNLPGLDRIEHYDTLPPELATTETIDDPGLKRLLTVDLASSQPVIVISPEVSLPVESIVGGVIPVVANSGRADLADLIVHGSLVSLPRLGFNNVERIRLSPREICEYLEPSNTTRHVTTPQSEVVDLRPPRSVSTLAVSHEQNASTTIALTPTALAAKITGPVPLRKVTASNEDFARDLPIERPTENDTSVEQDLTIEPQTENGTSVETGASQNGPIYRPVLPNDLGFTFMVSVLGPIKLDGVGLADSAKTWRYTKTAELLVLLATSDVPRTGDSLKELLWPARDPIKCGPALANATSDARIRVVGEQRFPKLAPGATLYKVDGIGTDLDLFEENLDRANASDSVEIAMEYRRAALRLVEGFPFDSFAHKSSGYGWADTLMMSATVQIVNVAVELARWEMDRDEPDFAADAAERGLRAAPENYELLNLFGVASLAGSNQERSREALAKIMELENSFLEGTPGLSEPELPDGLRTTQAALQKLLRYDSA